MPLYVALEYAQEIKRQENQRLANMAMAVRAGMHADKGEFNRFIEALTDG